MVLCDQVVGSLVINLFLDGDHTWGNCSVTGGFLTLKKSEEFKTISFHIEEAINNL